MPADVNSKIAAGKIALNSALAALSPATPSVKHAPKDGFATLLSIGAANNVLKQTSEKTDKRSVRKHEEKDPRDIQAAPVADPQILRDDRKQAAPGSKIKNSERVVEKDKVTQAPDSAVSAQDTSSSQPKPVNDKVPVASASADASETPDGTVAEDDVVVSVAVQDQVTPVDQAPVSQSLSAMFAGFQQTASALIQLLTQQSFTQDFIAKALSGADMAAANLKPQDAALSATLAADPKMQPFLKALGQFRQDYKAFASLMSGTEEMASGNLTVKQAAQAQTTLVSLQSDLGAMQQAVAEIAPSPKNAAAFQAVLEKLKLLHAALSRNIPTNITPIASKDIASLSDNTLSLPAAALPSVEAGEAPAAKPAVFTQTNVQAANPQADNLMAAAVTASASTSTNADTSSGGQQGQSNNGSVLQMTPVATASSTAHASGVQTPVFSRVLSQQQSYQPIAEQVMVNIKTAIKDGSSKIKIQLHPEDLGKLEIRIHVGADGRTGVTITADNKDTLAILQKDSSGLERALSDAGLKAETGGLSFNLRGGNRENNPEHSQASSTYIKALPEEEELLPANALTKNYVVNMAEGLDIKI